jgi:hypothetical protein
MGTTTISVSLSTNAAGFLSQECPACERTFKVQPGKGSPNPVTHCPYCNHEGEGCWLTKAQAQYVGAYGASHLLGPQLDEMAREVNRSARRGGMFSVKMTVNKPRPPRAPEEPEDEMPSVNFECCGETIRHDGATARLHCPICGRSS